MKIEELIEIIDDVDSVLHSHGYAVDHGLLMNYLFKVIKESYPNDNIELERPILLKKLPEIV